MSDLNPASTGARVSVIIPVFNGASHLADAVESVVIQTLAPHEIIFVDDGSTDSSAAILAALQSAHGENLPITSFGSPSPSRFTRRSVSCTGTSTRSTSMDGL